MPSPGPSQHYPDLLLYPQHERLLLDSGIAPKVAAARRYGSAETKAELEHWGFSHKQQHVPALVLPVWSAVTRQIAFRQIRPDDPRTNADGRTVKYECPPRVRMALDANPLIQTRLRDPSEALWVTEGARKSDAAISQGLCCLCLLGVWNWRGRNEFGGLTALPDWEVVALEGRDVRLTFDSDVMANPSVYAVLDRLTRFLAARGARVSYVYLPDDGRKVGLDDFLATHTVDQLEALVTTDFRRPRGAKESPSLPIDELRRRAAPVLLARDPLAHIGRAIRAQGYGGKLRPALLLHLAMSTRVLAMRRGSIPTHTLLVGPPSAGKNYNVQVNCNLLPDDAYVVIDSGSPRVLIYDDRDLRHRVLIFGEADSLPAGEDNPAASAIRSLLQDHCLRYHVVVRDTDTGKFTLHRIDKPGPTLLVTTACRRLGEQLESRLFAVDAPDDPAQIRAALAAQAGIELGGMRDPDPAVVAYQALLQAQAPWHVVVPFAADLSRALGRSPSAARVLRDYGKILSLIKAVAVIRHPLRERDGGGRLIATVEDYAVVYGLARDVYLVSKGGAGRVVRAAVEAVQALRADGVPTVTVAAVAERIGASRPTASRHVHAALEGGWLVDKSVAKGGGRNLDVGDPLPQDDGLPAPERLRSRPYPPVNRERVNGVPPESQSQGSVADGDRSPRFERGEWENHPQPQGPFARSGRSETVNAPPAPETVDNGASAEGRSPVHPKPEDARAVSARSEGRLWLDDVPDPAPEALPPEVPLAVDLETAGPGKPPLPWRGGEVLCFGFAALGRRWAHDLRDRESIQRLLLTPNPKIFHNAGYDLVWLRHAGFEVRGEIHDTLWARALADGAAVHGLKAIGPFEYDVCLPTNYGLFPGKVLGYCANDARSTLALFETDGDARQHPIYALYRRMALRVAETALVGLPVFRDAVAALHAEYAAGVAALDRQLREIAPINWRSADQVAAVLHDALPARATASGARRAVDDEALRECTHPAAALLVRKRELDKLIGTYLKPLLGKDRVHGLIALQGTWTGRTSSRAMNLQNIPGELRRLFGAERLDWVKVDFAAAELVVAAAVADCRPLLEAFREGRDPHRETAGRIFRKPADAVKPEERKLAKTLNFSLCYGGTAQTVVQRAASYGLSLSLDEANAFAAAWFEALPEIARWQKATIDAVEAGEAIRSPFGRAWRIRPDSRHQVNTALNAPIQSAASDLLLLGADRVWDRLPGVVVNLVHDEIDVVIPAGTFDEALWRVIARDMAAVDSRFPMAVEVAVGRSWGGTEERFTERGGTGVVAS